MFCGKPAAAPGQSRVQGSPQHDADRGLKCAERKILGARQKISGGIIHEHIERAVAPDHADHLVHGSAVAHIAAPSVNAASCALAQLSLGGGKNVFAPPADVDLGSEFKESLGCGLAEARASARNKDALVKKKIVPKHGRDCKCCGTLVARVVAGQSPVPTYPTHTPSHTYFRWPSAHRACSATTGSASSASFLSVGTNFALPLLPMATTALRRRPESFARRTGD